MIATGSAGDFAARRQRRLFTNRSLGIEYPPQRRFGFRALLWHTNGRRDQRDQLGHDFRVGRRASQAHGVHQQAQLGAGHHPGNRLEGKLQAHPQLIARQIGQRQGEGFEEALEHRLVMDLEVFLMKGEVSL